MATPIKRSPYPEGTAAAGLKRAGPALGVRVQNAVQRPVKTLLSLHSSKPLSLAFSLCVRVVPWADLDRKGFLVYPDLVVFARDPNHHDVREKILRQ